MTDCFWFMQNQCTKGESCEYRHSEAARDNSSTCKYWQEGKCSNQNCIFKHPSGVQAAGKAERSRIPCFFFQNGSCTKGSSCSFSHILSDGKDVATDSALVQQELKAKEELRVLQEERKKEEEKLAKLKAEAENLAKRKNQVKKSVQANRGTFAKSFEDLLKEKPNKKELKLKAKPQQPQPEQQKQKKQKTQAVLLSPPKKPKQTKQVLSQKPKQEITSQPQKRKKVSEDQETPNKRLKKAKEDNAIAEPTKTELPKKISFGVKRYEALINETATVATSLSNQTTESSKPATTLPTPTITPLAPVKPTTAVKITPIKPTSTAVKNTPATPVQKTPITTSLSSTKSPIQASNTVSTQSVTTPVIESKASPALDISELRKKNQLKFSKTGILTPLSIPESSMLTTPKKKDSSSDQVKPTPSPKGDAKKRKIGEPTTPVQKGSSNGTKTEIPTTPSILDIDIDEELLNLGVDLSDEELDIDDEEDLERQLQILMNE